MSDASPASLTRVLGAELFASEAPSELWARSIAALARDRAAVRGDRRLAREAEHKRVVLSRARYAYSRARQAERAGKAANVERARLIYEAAKVLCRPARQSSNSRRSLDKLKAAIVAMLRAHGGRLDAPALRRLLRESGALEIEDCEITRQSAAFPSGRR
jgi:hypothetical protein